MKLLRRRGAALAVAAGMIALSVTAASGYAEPMACNMSAYKTATGLSAVNANDTLTVSWSGDSDQELRLSFVVTDGTPIMRELAIRKGEDGAWTTVAANLAPEFRVVSGVRRISNQQLAPLRDLGVKLAADIVDRFRWDSFWDAPLDLESPVARVGNPPPAEGVGNSPGLPRKREEVKEAFAAFRVTGCEVRTNGGRIEVSFPGVTLGVFTGALQYTIFRGTNLIQQELLATTNQPWVAYKYDAGLKGFTVGSGSRVAWKDTSNRWQESRLGEARNGQEVDLKAASRLVVAERRGSGSIAVFPPPHNFFWAREIAINLGYNWFRRDDSTSFSIGVRQATHEDESENQANFALYSARPGTTQHMTMFIYPRAGLAAGAFDAALAFTHGDRYKPLLGYQVMNHHYHMDLGQRLGQADNLDAEIPDLVALKALGINIVSQIDSIQSGVNATPPGAVFPGAAPVRGSGANLSAPEVASGASPLEIRYNSIEGAKRHSDSTFLVLPSQEFYGSPLGGHTDLLFSHPVYWLVGRAMGQPLVDEDPKYGKIYHIGDADDLMEMARREDILINMPHPRTKGSTGFPDAIKDLPFFSDPHYQGIGFRWGMGLDRSERRLCEYRCQPLIDDMSNWVVNKAIPLKKILSISEVRHMQPGDEIYSSAPVTYVKLPSLPQAEDHSAVIQALMRGESFVSSGEVLIPSFSITRSGSHQILAPEIEWTFPLDFIEVIWGDGTTTGRQVIPTTELPPMARRRFNIPFDPTGKKWVRIAAWDSAGNGAMGQPVRVN